VIDAIALPERELVGLTLLSYSDVVYGVASAQVHVIRSYLPDSFLLPLISDPNLETSRASECYRISCPRA
jgi:hypothetical protein